ncbi:peroxiredoxin family protein [Reichenbachiella versicolor]|uniref:peroxiredoxin family protein n=1 Tax=Reichenbachiella versicolor TaxID=1821036 RepID=UPI000D6E1C98|nr:TlpA disulfide reductase family protein [Reichenbachiella versicolor]
MKNLFLILILTAFSITYLTSCTEDSEDNNLPDTSTNGSTAPAFTLTSVDGGESSLSDFNGSPVIIFFFGDECPLCKAAAPSIESELAQKYKDTDVAIIGIDTWNGTRSSVASFRSSTGVSFDLLLNGSEVAKNYGTTFDRLVVIDAEGNIAFKGRSSADNDIDNVISTIEGL